MNSENLMVLTNIIGAVESGGQVYGNRRYDAYTPPYTNTPNEHTITLGWAQNYGDEAEKLIRMILDADPAAFRKIDSGGSIEAMLKKNWVNIRWHPSSSQKNTLIKLITSKNGKTAQDELFIELMKKFISDCGNDYTADIPAQMMYCEIRHLGGKKSAQRIFNRCNGNYSLSKIMSALKADQSDTSSDNQVGDKKFWSRHEKCKEFIEKYAVSEGSGMTALQRAKILLRQPKNETMTGYTPTGSGYFKNAGQYFKTPKKGDVIYFYGLVSSEGRSRVHHTGIVINVDTASKRVYTIEGNTSDSHYDTNGNVVGKHNYSYASVGGSNKVNGFGRPNFEGAGVTADDFVKKALSYYGYHEKASNKDLNSFFGNAGSNNYQKFQPEVGAGNGDQWCQYFVDAMAFETCGGGTTPSYEPETPVSNSNVAIGQQWLNTYYGALIVKCFNDLLIVDGEYGSKSRAAALAVWKDLMNRKYRTKLTPTNTNFFESCKKAAVNATVKYGSTGTFTLICQLILSARGYYTGAMDTDCKSNMCKSIQAYKKKNGLKVESEDADKCTCDADMWYSLFN